MQELPIMTDLSDSATWVRPIREHLLARFSDDLLAQASRSDQLNAAELSAVADELLATAVNMGASDIHLTPYSDRLLIRVRIDGALHDVLQLPVSAGMHLIRHFKVMAELDTSRSFKPLDARQTRRIGDLDVDLRLACVPCITGENLAIRLLNPLRIERHVADLGLCEPERGPIDQWLTGSGGMLLVTGPTGSGKTTTLCAAARAKNDRQVCSDRRGSGGIPD